MGKDGAGGYDPRGSRNKKKGFTLELMHSLVSWGCSETLRGCDGASLFDLKIFYSEAS